MDDGEFEETFLKNFDIDYNMLHECFGEILEVMIEERKESYGKKVDIRVTYRDREGNIDQWYIFSNSNPLVILHGKIKIIRDSEFLVLPSAYGGRALYVKDPIEIKHRRGSFGWIEFNIYRFGDRNPSEVRFVRERELLALVI